MNSSPVSTRYRFVTHSDQMGYAASGDIPGSRPSERPRHNILQLVANQLPKLGYTHMGASSLKPKHIEALVQHWKSEGLSVGTLKQRLSALRWWAAKVGKPNIIARDNAYYGIGPRQLVSHESKARALDKKKLDKINNPYVRASLQLQQAFGLRREEAIKFIPLYADQGDHIRLKASRTKGGKQRVIPVRTEAQRALLDELKQTFGASSLIPPNRRYVDQLQVYEKQTVRAGLHKNAWAQARLCSTSLPRTHRLALSSLRWPHSSTTFRGSKTAGQRSTPAYLCRTRA